MSTGNDPDGSHAADDRGRWRASRREFCGVFTALVASRLMGCTVKGGVNNDKKDKNGTTTNDDGPVHIDE